MSDLISRQDAIALVIKAIHGTDNKEIQEYLFDGLRKQMWSLPSADRPTGEVDAVAIYEKAEHELEHGKITLGEYEKRIEPLKHLYYDRPTGEWSKEIKGNGWNEWAVLTCDQCGTVIENPTFKTNYCPNCGAKMGGDTT